MKLNISSIIATALLACAGIEAKLTESQKSELLSLHKSARSAVHASNMKSISWDSSLAADAQEYSSLCKGMVHSGVGGENLAGSTTGDVSRMFNNWMKEKSGFDRSGYRSSFLGVSYGGEDIGHYSQIVWAENTKVGCGLTYCENFSAKYLLVCRYGTGNILKQEVYAKGSGSDHDDESKKTTSTERKTTTTTKKTTTTTTHHHTTTTTVKPTTTKEQKPTNESEPSTSHDDEKKENDTTTQETSQETTIPTLDSNGIVEGNSTVINTNTTITTDNNNNENSVPIEINNEKTVSPDGTVETKNINDNYKKDGIIDEVGPSGYDDGTGTIITGVALSGSVIGAAAAFVFYKKNPKQYRQLAKNMKTIQRGITKRANTVKHSASAVTRKFTTKRQNSSSRIQRRVPNQLDSSDCNINTSSDCSIDNMPMMTEMADLPTENVNYRSELAQNLEN